MSFTSHDYMEKRRYNQRFTIEGFLLEADRHYPRKKDDQTHHLSHLALFPSLTFRWFIFIAVALDIATLEIALHLF
jgi:hypothetical protein